MQFTLKELQARLGGELEGDADGVITGVNGLDGASASQLSYAEKASMLAQVQGSPALAFLVPEDFPAVAGKTLLRLAAPKRQFIEVVRWFHPERLDGQGVHAHASVDPRAVLADDVTVAACAVVREGARIGSGTRIETGAHIGTDVVLGADCRIGPNVVLKHGVRLGDRVCIDAGTVIGGEGFGYLWDGERHLRIPQVGTVQIDDEVEIGCNCCIDRATFGITHIGRGAKIDNLVQIGHNNIIGEHSILVSQVGLSGSVTVGKGVILAGKVGVTDHTRIGDGVIAGGAAVITKDVAPAAKVMGAPARSMGRVLKELSAVGKLPELIPQIKRLIQRVDALEKR